MLNESLFVIFIRKIINILKNLSLQKEKKTTINTGVINKINKAVETVW